MLFELGDDFHKILIERWTARSPCRRGGGARRDVPVVRRDGRGAGAAAGGRGAAAHSSPQPDVSYGWYLELLLTDYSHESQFSVFIFGIGIECRELHTSRAIILRTSADERAVGRAELG